MRKCLIFATMFAALAATTGIASAESIKGKFGVTARGGFLVPADSKLVGVAPLDDKLEADTGFAVGGGFIYGISDNVAAEVDVTYSKYDVNSEPLAAYYAALYGVNMNKKFAETETYNVSLGAQYRFTPESTFVPYVGAGVDFIVIEATDKFLPQFGLPAEELNTDLSFGGHLSVGADIFLTKQIAFNAEFKGVLATEADVEDSTGTKIAKGDPSNFSGLFGFRFFF